MAQHLRQILGDTLLTTLLDGQIPQQLPSPQVRIFLGFVIFLSYELIFSFQVMKLVLGTQMLVSLKGCNFQSK